jgi:hypothetical protein
MFSIDRPARGYIFEIAFNLFGTNPFPFHLMFSIIRFFSGISILWLIKTILPNQEKKAIWVSILFVLYPGYLWWVSGIEYLPMNLSVFLQILSICFSISALRTGSKIKELIYIILSILTGWGYIALVDYSIGLEVSRYLIIILYLRNEIKFDLIKTKVRLLLNKSFVYLVIPGGYLIWRFLFFKNIRPETDLTLQLSGLIQDPFYTSVQWFFNLIKSFLNSTVFSWIMPFYDYFFNLRLKHMILILSIVILSGILISLLIQKIFRRIEINSKKENEINFYEMDRELLIFSSIGIIAGIIPIVVANRYIDSHNFSHYALPVSMVIVLFVVGLVYFIKNNWLRHATFILLLLISMITHHSKAISTLNEQKIIENFWWQMTWRGSELKSGVTLLVNYQGLQYGEDEDIVWGPANLIYSSIVGSEIPIIYPIYAIPQTQESTKKILYKNETIYQYRTHGAFLDYGNILVISQPSSNSCVHVMDNKWPRLSTYDPDQILLISGFSNIENLILEGEKAYIPINIFGSEPEKDWCYYYQFSEKALQKGDYDEVYTLEKEALSKGFRPNDRTEWMPFLQAAVMKGDIEKIVIYSSYINEIPFLQYVTCMTFNSMIENDINIPEQS